MDHLKVPKDDATARFRAADKDSSGVLSVQQMSAVLSSMCPGMGHEEVRSTMSYIDANKDGKVSYDEFVTWLASAEGAHL